MTTFHDEVTKRKTRPRTSVLLTEPFVFADGPNEFTRDCALIELYRDKIRLEEHVHGKEGLLYIGTFPIFLFCLPWTVIVPKFQLKLTIISPAGGSLSPSNFGKLMFSSRSPSEVQVGYDYPDDGLLQGL